MSDTINKARVLAEFLELVQVRCSTHDEREIGNILTKRLTALGGTVHEDNAGEKLGGNCGNLVADFPASDAAHNDLPTIMLTAHMDCVEPCGGVHPIRENGIIRSDGTTILGGDDKAGVTAILETHTRIKFFAKRYGSCASKRFPTAHCRSSSRLLRKTASTAHRILTRASCMPISATRSIRIIIPAA